LSEPAASGADRRRYAKTALGWARHGGRSSLAPRTSCPDGVAWPSHWRHAGSGSPVAADLRCVA
jgi:hypothetical protein